MITKTLTWAEYRVILFERIQSIIEAANCSKYTILGWKHLDTKLILHYDDWERVFEFEFNQMGTDYLNTDISKQFGENAYYTKDFTHEERLTEINFFKENWDRRVAE